MKHTVEQLSSPILLIIWDICMILKILINDNDRTYY